MATATQRDYFDAALRLLAHAGRTGLRIGRLCAAVGVTSGSFYHHFGSWEGFVSALLEHWEGEEVGRIVELVHATPDPVERIRRVKDLSLTVPHDAEVAIRSWAAADPVVAAAQRAVDAGRRRALDDVLSAVVADPDLRRTLAALGMSILAGHQQLSGSVADTDLAALLDQFDLLVRAHVTGTWDPVGAEAAPWSSAPDRR